MKGKSKPYFYSIIVGSDYKWRSDVDFKTLFYL